MVPPCSSIKSMNNRPSPRLVGAFIHSDPVFLALRVRLAFSLILTLSVSSIICWASSSVIDLTDFKTSMIYWDLHLYLLLVLYRGE